MRCWKGRHKQFAWFISLLLVFHSGLPAHAYTRVDGLFSLENAYGANQDNTTNLFKSGISLSFRPPTKKSLDTRVNVRLDYTNADGDSLWNLSPIGNLGVDMAGDNFALNLQHLRTATITTDAELVESKTYRASLTLSPDYWPRMTASYSHLEQVTDGVDTSIVDLYSFYADYGFRHWLNLRTGFDLQDRDSGANQTSSNSMLLGVSINRELLARTQLTADTNFVRSSSESQTGLKTTNVNTGFRVGIESRPVPLLGLGGRFAIDTTSNESALTADSSTTNRNYDLTATLYPMFGTRIWSTFGNRTFEGETDDRSVDYLTFGGNLNRDLTDKISLNLTASRSFEYDPDQGDNTRDTLGFNSLLDLTPRTSLRFNLNVTRNESPGFIRTEGYDFTGNQGERENLTEDDQLVDDNILSDGDTFYEEESSLLYTYEENDVSLDPGVWVNPVRVDPPSEEKFYVTKSLQLNLQATDKLSLILFYSLSGSSEQLNLLKSDRQTLNSSLVYQPNRRTSYSMTGNYSSSSGGRDNYNGTLGINYRFFRGDQLNLSYGMRTVNDETSDSFSAGLRLAFPKRSNLELTYSGSQVFQEDQTYFLRARFTHTF